MVYGILKGPSELMSPVDCTASLKGQIRDQPLEYSIPFEVPGNSPSFPIPIIHHLASKALIKDWERDGGNKKSEIVKLSIESSVVSSHTAFVAIDDNNQPVKGAMKTWDITAKMAESDISGSGYANQCFSLVAPHSPPTMAMCQSAPQKRGGLMSKLSGLIPSGAKRKAKQPTVMACSAPPPMASSMVFDEEELCAAPMPLKSRAMKSDMLSDMVMEREDVCDSKSSRSSRSSSGPGPTGHGTDSLSSLISLQQADGSWKLDDVIAKVLSKSLKELRDACPVKCDGGVSTIWATVLCCVYLELKHPSQKDEWELIAMKAELWLDGQSLPAGTDLKKMKDAARKIIA